MSKYMLHAQNNILYLRCMLHCLFYYYSFPGTLDHWLVVFQNVFLFSTLFRDTQSDQDQKNLLWVQNLLSYFRTCQRLGDHHDFSVKCNRLLQLGKIPKPTGNKGSMILMLINAATQLDAKRLPVISSSSPFPNKIQCQGQGRTGGEMINLENHLPTPALRFHRSARMKVKTPLCLLAFGLCNMNFNPGERVVGRAVESSQTQIGLSCFSGILQNSIIPHLSSSETKTVPAYL